MENFTEDSSRSLPDEVRPNSRLYSTDPEVPRPSGETRPHPRPSSRRQRRTLKGKGSEARGLWRFSFEGVVRDEIFIEADGGGFTYLEQCRRCLGGRMVPDLRLPSWWANLVTSESLPVPRKGNQEHERGVDRCDPGSFYDFSY